MDSEWEWMRVLHSSCQSHLLSPVPWLADVWLSRSRTHRAAASSCTQSPESWVSICMRRHKFRRLKNTKIHFVIVFWHSMHFQHMTLHACVTAYISYWPIYGFNPNCTSRYAVNKGKFSIRSCQAVHKQISGHVQHFIRAFWFLTQVTHAMVFSLLPPGSSRQSSVPMCSFDCIFVFFEGFLVCYVFFPFLSNFWNYFLLPATFF